jgi:hypothetical protein
MRYALGFLAFGVLFIAADALDWHVLFVFAGAYLSIILDRAVEDLKASARPATKAERRIARSVESAVAQRSLTLDRDTGAHAA